MPFAHVAVVVGLVHRVRRDLVPRAVGILRDVEEHAAARHRRPPAGGSGTGFPSAASSSR